MNGHSGKKGWLRRLLERVGGPGEAGPSAGAPARRRDEGEDEGPGVLVPAGPRPRRGGAGARPPQEREAR